MEVPVPANSGRFTASRIEGKEELYSFYCQVRFASYAVGIFETHSEMTGIPSVD